MARASDTPSDTFNLADQDKQLHLVASYALTFTSTEIMQHYKIERWKAILYSSLITMALGTAKELWMDKFFSGPDVLADFIGVGLSCGVVLTFDL